VASALVQGKEFPNGIHGRFGIPYPRLTACDLALACVVWSTLHVAGPPGSMMSQFVTVTTYNITIVVSPLAMPAATVTTQPQKELGDGRPATVEMTVQTKQYFQFQA
jgi:hypothetical protein